MDGLPHGIDLTALIGAKYYQVCFSRFQCTLSLDNDARITVEGGVKYTSPTGKITVTDEYSTAATALGELLEIAVSAYERTADGGLVLKHSNGATLEVFNDVKAYESFQVHLQGKVYVA